MPIEISAPSRTVGPGLIEAARIHYTLTETPYTFPDRWSGPH